MSNLKINLTDSAVQKTKEKILKDNKSKTTVLRLGVLGGKCAGYSYLMQFEDETKIKLKRDQVFDFNGLKVVVDNKSLVYLNDSTLDYETKSLMNYGYKFINPNVEKSCGCGESFSLKDKS